MNPVPITLLYGGACALLTTLLGVNVSLRRLAGGVYMGRDVPKELVRPIRAHGNAAEWVPLGIVLLGLLELSGAGSTTLHVYGGTLLLARILHAFGALAKNRATMIAATLTYIVMAGMSGQAIWLHFHA